MKDIPLEIERKFLIKMPDLSSLQAASHAVWQIEQMYLQCFEKGEVRRIRRVTCAGKVQYFYTEKRHVSELSCEEREQKITAPEYEACKYSAAGQPSHPKNALPHCLGCTYPGDRCVSVLAGSGNFRSGTGTRGRIVYVTRRIAGLPGGYRGHPLQKCDVGISDRHRTVGAVDKILMYHLFDNTSRHKETG